MDDGELLDDEATEIIIGYGTASCISCEPTPFGGVQDAANVVTGGAPAFCLVYFGGCDLGITNFPDLKIIHQV